MALQQILNGLICSENYWKEFKISPNLDKVWPEDGQFPAA
jgi:hypothetical protein